MTVCGRRGEMTTKWMARVAPTGKLSVYDEVFQTPGP
jgi:hypothetical protein